MSEWCRLENEQKIINTSDITEKCLILCFVQGSMPLNSFGADITHLTNGTSEEVRKCCHFIVTFLSLKNTSPEGLKKLQSTEEISCELSLLANLNEYIFFQHLLAKIKEEPMSEEETEAPQTDLPLQCLLCAKDFQSVTGLKVNSYYITRERPRLCSR